MVRPQSNLNSTFKTLNLFIFQFFEQSGSENHDLKRQASVAYFLLFFLKKKESWKGYCLGPNYISQWIIYLKVKTLNTISHWLQSNNNNMLKIVDMVVKRRTQGKCSHEKSYNESIGLMLGVM